MEEEIIDWTTEATAVMNDIRKHVKECKLSEKFHTNASEAYINMTTLEDIRICIKLDRSGLQVVGRDYDVADIVNSNNSIYETPYSLLSSISGKYVQSFGDCLTSALNQIKDNEMDEN
jgi:hypothetical protein